MTLSHECHLYLTSFILHSFGSPTSYLLLLLSNLKIGPIPSLQSSIATNEDHQQLHRSSLLSPPYSFHRDDNSITWNTRHQPNALSSAASPLCVTSSALFLFPASWLCQQQRTRPPFCHTSCLRTIALKCQSLPLRIFSLLIIFISNHHHHATSSSPDNFIFFAF